MAIRWAITGGSWSNVTTWNDGGTLGIPTSTDDVWTNGFTVNMDVNATVITLNNSAAANFNNRILYSEQFELSNWGINDTYASVASVTSNVIAAPDGTTTADALAYVTNVNNASRRQQSFTRVAGVTYIFSLYVKKNTASSVTVGLDFNSPGANWGGVNYPSISYNFDTDTLSPSSPSLIFGRTLLPNGWVRLWAGASASNAGTSSGCGIQLSSGSTNNNLYVWGGMLNTGNTLLNYERTVASTTTTLGGSFNLNTAGVSVATTSSLTPAASNLFTVTATGGTVSLSILGFAGLSGTLTPVINHTGNCDFIFSQSTNLSSGGVGGNIVLSKTGLGNLTINANIVQQTTVTSAFALSSIAASGTTTINGNVLGNSNTGSGSHGINQTGGNLIVNGLVQGSFTNTTTYGINFAGTSLTVNGNVIGALGSAILTTTPVTVNGNVFANASAGISTTSAIAITVSGDVYSSTIANGISSTNASGIVNLTGNMYNTLGRNAIYCQNIFISNSATTLWRMDIGGGLTRTLYSADSFPNLPSTSDVRNLIQYGPASGLTGTMIVASPSDIRRNVLTDNTVGTADITAQDILNFINTSSDPLAVRMRTMLTDNSAGQLISEYNFV